MTERIRKGVIQYKIEAYTGFNDARVVRKFTEWLYDNPTLRGKMAEAGYVYMDKHNRGTQAKVPVKPIRIDQSHRRRNIRTRTSTSRKPIPEEVPGQEDRTTNLECIRSDRNNKILAEPALVSRVGVQCFPERHGRYGKTPQRHCCLA